MFIVKDPLTVFPARSVIVDAGVNVPVVGEMVAASTLLSMAAMVADTVAPPTERVAVCSSRVAL
jgi:hypothetical protein